MDSKRELLPIQEVARAAGVSSRTLRHYDEIGVLRPTEVHSGGIRYYGRDQLLRLQRILLMRQLDLSLAVIKTVLDEQTSEVDALRRHRQQLTDARMRLSRLEKTIDRTIEDLEGARKMNATELFDGFDADQQKEYEKEIVDKYGQQAQAHIDESWQKIGKMSKAQAEEISKAFPQINASVAKLMKAGVPADDDQMQALIAEHYCVVSEFWTPNAEQYIGLGQMYCDDERFRADYDSHDPRLAEFFRDAMDFYATNQLA